MKIQLVAVAALAYACLTTAYAQANPYQRGPDPSLQSLEAAKGPYTVASAKVKTPKGYGAGTVYYPTVKTEGPFGVVVLSPGFLAIQSYYTWLAERAASHGFVVVTINLNSIYDQPEVRGPQLMAALKQVVALSKTAGTPYFGVVDETRLAVMGHSMGGGGTLAAARDNPSLKAAVAITPWHEKKDFSTISVPTLVLACQNDAIAPNDQHSWPFYQSFNGELSSAYMEVKGANHLCGIQMSSAKGRVSVGKYAIAWLKRFLDADTRYTPFVSSSAPDLSKSAFRGDY